MSPLYVMIIAGGRGTRFWPRSRAAMPKQCMSVDGRRTLIQATLDRVAPVVPIHRVLVVTSATMAPALAAQLPDLPAENLLVEPEGRNTAPAVAWGSREIQRRDPDAVVAVLPADHLIARPDELLAVLESARQAALDTGALVTIGLEPTRPETGFGYLQTGERAGDFGGREVLRVERFVEKPDLATARRYLDEGGFLWNAGMFVFTVSSMRQAVQRYLPRLAEGLDRLAEAPSRLGEIYPRLPSVSLDVGVMERAEQVLTVPATLGWSDVGSWDALGDHLPSQAFGTGLVAHSLAVDARDNLVHAPDKLVALVGVEGLVVVDTGDALMVCRREDAQRVRELITQLEDLGLDEYL